MITSHANLNLRKDVFPETVTFSVFISDLNEGRQGDGCSVLMLGIWVGRWTSKVIHESPGLMWRGSKQNRISVETHRGPSQSSPWLPRRACELREGGLGLGGMGLGGMGGVTRG